MNKNDFFKRLAFNIGGVILIGIGIAWMRFADLGTDPFSSMVLGIANLLGTSFWYAQMGVLASLLLIVVFTDRSYIGIGTLINLVLLGFSSDTFLAILETFPLPTGFVGSLAELIIGVLLICYGVAMYMHASLGIASYDALAPIIEAKTNGKLPFRWARIMTDALCIAVGFTLGSTIGIGTAIMAFFTGPVVAFFNRFFKSETDR